MNSEQSTNQDIAVIDLTDSIGNKEIDEAIQILDKLISQKKHPIELLLLIHNRFEKLYNYKLAISQNKDIAEFLSLRRNQEFLIPKFKKHSDNYTKEELSQILAALELLKVLYHIFDTMDLGLALKSIICAIERRI